MCWSCPISSWNQSVLLSMRLWNATVCLISPQREQIDSYRALNKENCSSERERLSNKYRISWIIAKPEQVFYRLVGTHFFHLPGDVLELEGEKQLCVTMEDQKRYHVPETDHVGSCFQGTKINQEEWEMPTTTNLFFLTTQISGAPPDFLFVVKEPQIKRLIGILLLGTRKSQFTKTRKGTEILFL